MTNSMVQCPFFQPGCSHFCAVVSSQPDHPKAATGTASHSPQCDSGGYICCPLYEHVQRRLEAVHQRREGWAPPLDMAC
ncbi:MAG: hypothetical protein JRI68_29440 [Deltaproteobacteria bacterium]|nr:hypothetical protein [Deltaproteobacteria bacterium]